MRKNCQLWLLPLLFGFAAIANAQSFRVQCPTSTITHPSSLHDNNSEPAYSAPTTQAIGPGGYLVPSANVNGAIKCQQISGGDGYSTMGDGTQTYMFSFGPLSGIADITNGLPGTQVPSVFNTEYTGTFQPGDPATTDPNFFADQTFKFNGAVGLTKDIPNSVTVYDISEAGHTVTVVANTPAGFSVGDSALIAGLPGYNGTYTVTAINVGNPIFPASYAFQYTSPATGLAEVTESPTGTASAPPRYDGHVDPRPIMDLGVMNGNIPAPLMALDEDDEYFLTLTNVGMIMADTYNSLVPGNTLTISDPGQGVIANDTNVYGVQLLAAPAAGKVTLNSNGTFTYVPNSGTTADSFTYCANGSVTGTTCSSGISATVTVGAAAIEGASGITVRPDSYTSNVSASLNIAPPGVLANDSDAAGYPLSVTPGSYAFVSGPGTLTISLDKSGSFNAQASAPGTYIFSYKAQNSQGSVSTASAQVTLNFPVATGLKVTVVDGKDKTTAIGDYRWVIEEDRTFYIDPLKTTNTGGTTATTVVPTFGTNFHTSYMPVVATGCVGPTGSAVACEYGQMVVDSGVPCVSPNNPVGCSATAGQHLNAVCDIGNGVCRTDAQLETIVDPSQVHLDPTKRYYISVLPGDAANAFNNATTSACTSPTDPNCGHERECSPQRDHVELLHRR